MPHLKTLLKWSVRFGAVMALALGLAQLRLSPEPRGLVNAYPISRHERSDVALFQNGKVTLKTCCGDWPYGTYEQDSQGKWIWNIRLGTQQVLYDTVEISSGLFTVRVQSVSSGLVNHTLRRRLFQSVPF